MTSANTTNLDPDAPPITPSAASRGRILPWVVALLATAAAFLLLGLLINRPAQVAQPPAPTGPSLISDSLITSLGQGAQWSTEWRDASGRDIAILNVVSPQGTEDVQCQFFINDDEVTATGTGGKPAICFWAREP